MLLGSDYTEGVAGIGIVNAMETLHVYPTLDALEEFRKWLESPDYTRFEPMGRHVAKGRTAKGAPWPALLPHAPCVITWQMTHCARRCDASFWCDDARMTRQLGLQMVPRARKVRAAGPPRSPRQSRRKARPRSCRPRGC
jgi:hypothetical protein